MNEESLNLTALLALVLASFAYLGWNYRTKDSDEFHTARRQVGIVRIISSLFTVVGASEFVIFTTLAYLYGQASIAFFVGALLGFVALAGIAPFMRERAAELDVHSIPDLARVQGMSQVRVGLTILSVIFTGALVLIQMIIGGRLVVELTGTSFSLSAFLLILAVVTYLFWGGYQALLFTDVVQAIVMLLFTAGFAWFLIVKAAEITGDVGPIVPPSTVPLDILGLLVGGFFAIFGGPEIWQRVLTSRSDKAAQRGLVISGIVMLGWGWLIVLGGTLIQELNPTAPENDAFFIFLGSDVPAWLLGGLLITLLAAILSTADTELFAATIILRKQLSSDSLTDIRATRIVLVVLAAIAFGVSLFTQNVLDIYFWLVYMAFITGPIGFVLLLRRGGARSQLRRRTTIMALVLGSVTFIILWIQGLLVSWYPILIAIASSFPLILKKEVSE